MVCLDQSSITALSKQTAHKVWGHPTVRTQVGGGCRSKAYRNVQGERGVYNIEHERI